MEQTKKWIALLFCLCLSMTLFGCGSRAGNENPAPVNAEASSPAEEADSVSAKGTSEVERVVTDVNILIAYFSWADNAETDSLDQARAQLDNGEHPELAERVANIENYDVIFLGFPNWWYTIPVAINSFVEAHDLSGKTIIPFVSHGTGGLAGTIKDLTAILPEDCQVLQSYDVYEDNVSDVREEVNDWLESLGY